MLTVGAAGPWWDALSEEEQDEVRELEGISDTPPEWEEPYGDRRQELVFIGADMDEAEIRARLEAALLTDEELAAGPEAWASFPDPFPTWELVDPEDEHHEHGALAFDPRTGRALGDPTDPRVGA